MQDWKCALGLHHYEVYKEFEIGDYRGNPIMRVIVSRCANCGRIKVAKVSLNPEEY